MAIEVGNSVVNSSNSPSLGAGLIANRPVKTGANSIYIATDQKKIYQFIANAWVLIIDGSGGGGGGSVNSVTGTAGQIDAVDTAGAVVLSLSNPMNVPGDFVVAGGSEFVGGVQFDSGVDFTQNIEVDNGINGAGVFTADSFVKNGGTSSQFLKADGSVDNTVYAAFAALASYLLLTGGTLTGRLDVSYNAPFDVFGVKNLNNASSSSIAFYNSGGTIKGSYGYLNPANLVYPFPNSCFFFTANVDFIISTDGGAHIFFKVKATTGEVTVTNSLTAASFIKTGGTSSQFLKADGSVSTGTNNVVASNDVANSTIITNTLFSYFVPAGADASFSASGYFEILAAVGAGMVVDMFVTYTTPNGTLASKDFFDGGGINPPVLNVGIVSNYQVMGEIRAKAGTPITITFQANGATVTSVNYNTGATLQQIR